MNLVSGPSGENHLSAADLAAMDNFILGGVIVSPSTRVLRGPAGTVTVEPRVMQVLVVLADSAGQVVTRESLFSRCWSGVYVGDDSLNRAVAAVRRAAVAVGGRFEIETIPRTGYRLTGEKLTATPEPPPSEIELYSGISRRSAIAGGAALAAAGVAGLGLWSVTSERDRRYNALLQRGEDGLEFGDGSAQPSIDLRQAALIRPNDAAANGLLAYSLMANADAVYSNGSDSVVLEAESAARTALRLNSTDVNARLALILLQRSTLDLAATEDRLRALLMAAPRNIFVMRRLWDILQSTGRSREALAVVERAMVIKPLAATNNYPLAQLLWIVGRIAEADRVIDRAIQFWPSHRYVRFARFTIFAFTGRPRAALGMLDDDGTRPQNFSRASVELWRISLRALEHPSEANISEARRANLDGVQANPRLASQAVLTLSALGDVDTAFDIANDLLLFRAPSRSSPATGSSRAGGSSMAWRFTPWLFTPPAAALRADRRFAVLCDGIGLTDYWKKRGITPDYQRG